MIMKYNNCLYLSLNVVSTLGFIPVSVIIINHLRASSSYSSSGTASGTLYNAQYWVVVFQPRTAATSSLYSFPIVCYVTTLYP